MAMNPLPSLIRASAQDAGTIQANAAGRKAWNRDDANKAAETLDRLVRGTYGKSGENQPEMCFVRFAIAEQMERSREFTLQSNMTEIHAAIEAAIYG